MNLEINGTQLVTTEAVNVTMIEMSAVTTEINLRQKL